MTRQGWLGTATQVLTAMSVALSIAVAGPAGPASAASDPDLEVDFYEGQTTLATTRERVNFTARVADIREFNFENPGVVLYVNIPPAFIDIKIDRAINLSCEVMQKVTPASDSVVRCKSPAIGLGTYGENVTVSAVAPPTTGRFTVNATVHTVYVGQKDRNQDNNSADLLVVVGSGSVAPVKTQPQRAR